MSAISFENVSVVFGDTPERALPLMDAGESREEILAKTGQVLGAHNCTLEVKEGEILVLMGLSGSGKSTLLRTVNGLNPITRGKVQIGGLDIGTANSAALRDLRQNRVAMVFQQFGLLPWRTVRDNVGFGLELRGLDKKARDAIVTRELEIVGLTERADAKVSELSGGMQQRVGLARAFATDAPILLMDEPFSALDPLIRSRLQDELLTLQRERKRTILFVSHDLDEAFKLGSRIAIMDGGRIVQCGTAREILTRPATSMVSAFTQHMNPLDVLHAADIAEKADQLEGHLIPSDTPLRQVLLLLVEHPHLICAEGLITMATALKALQR